jgi:hypothetical protein
MGDKLEKLLDRCNEMDITEQLNWLGDASMPYQAKLEYARLQKERDTAIENANTYRQRVFVFLDGMIENSQTAQAMEERKGLVPDRAELRNAIAYIRKAFENHNYLIEAQVDGAVAEMVASGEWTVYKNGEDLISASGK